MRSNPPPIPPPPFKHPGEQPEENNRTYWMIASAVFLGALLAMLILPWLAMKLNIGEESDRSENGGSGNRAASLDAGSSSSISAADVNGAASDKVVNTSKQNETGNTDVDPARVKGQTPKAESDTVEDMDAIGDKVEAKLLIVQEKRIVGTPSRSGSRGQSLDDLGGSNPFVGSGPPAKSTVYVIDVSGSMQMPDRLPRVISTLKRALELLNPDQKFLVVLFDENYHLHPVERELMPANKRNKKVICDWLDGGLNGGGTNPLPAMLFAVQQKPERIVLLSDGEFDPASALLITQANKSNPKPAIIDCVGLMEEVETLKSIARSNKGIYYQAY